MNRHKQDILVLLEKIFLKLESQDLPGVTFKDVVDFVYRNRKSIITEDETSVILLTKYFKSLNDGEI